MEDHIKFKRIRPRFLVETSLTSDEINQRIRSQLKSDQFQCEGSSIKGYATIYPCETEQHFWSPQLTITLDDVNGTTHIRGLYGPKPAVWTMFVFVYSVIAFAILVISMLGLSYWSLDMPATILWWVPALTLLFFTFYLSAYFGQKLGQKQMTTLHRFLETCIEEEIETT